VTGGRLVLIKNIERGRGEVGCTEKTATKLIFRSQACVAKVGFVA
jgi:hypothetical protein